MTTDDGCDRRFEVTDCRGAEILTVGAFRQMIEGVPDDMQIVIDDKAESWWNNVSEVIVPGSNPEIAEHSAITLVAGYPLDTRQF
jgi:hypothetical protein